MAHHRASLVSRLENLAHRLASFVSQRANLAHRLAFGVSRQGIRRDDSTPKAGLNWRHYLTGVRWGLRAEG